MQSKPIAEGITAIIEYCCEVRTNDTIKRYEKTCNSIRAYYDKSGQTYYNIGINNEIRDHFCGELKSNTAIRNQNDPYLFRILGMLDDYYNGHPFRDKYPCVSRYKNQLQPFYQQLAEEFKESLTVSKNTVPVIYSIARDFFYLIMQFFFCKITESLFPFYSKHLFNGFSPAPQNCNCVQG